MRFREWIKGIFLTEPQLSTGKPRLKLKPTLIAFSAVFVLLLLFKSIFSEASVKADTDSYKPVTSDTVARNGEVVLKMGQYEVKKHGTGGNVSSYRSSSADSGADQGQVISRKDRARSEYILPAGTKIPVTLEGDLNSQLGHSPIVAHIKEGFSFKGRLLIPGGSKVLGKAGEASDDGRLSVTFDQIVYPNGVQVGAQSVGMMEDGSPGVVGEYHSGRWKQYAASVGLSFLSGAAAALESSQANAFGFDQPEQSSKNAILNGVSRATLDQGKRVGEDAQNKEGYVTLASGSGFVIYFEKEVDLSGVLE